MGFNASRVPKDEKRYLNLTFGNYSLYENSIFGVSRDPPIFRFFSERKLRFVTPKRPGSGGQETVGQEGGSPGLATGTLNQELRAGAGDGPES